MPGDLLRSVAPTQTPAKQVLFLCALPDHALPAKLSGSRYLVLDNLQDPGNLGTLWRTADAFGADGLILLPGCADPWGRPRPLRATMGACFRLPVWEGTLEELLPRLQAAELPLYATALREDTEDIRTVSLRRAAVVIGSEGRGSPPVLAASEKDPSDPHGGPVRVPQRRGRRYGGAVADGIRRLTNRKGEAAMSNLRHWLWLSTRGPAPGMYAARVLEHFGTPEGAYYADSAAYGQIPGIPGTVRQALEDKDLTPAETILAKCKEQGGIWILTMQDAAYPQRLRQLESAPCVLYGKGTPPSWTICRWWPLWGPGRPVPTG